MPLVRLAFSHTYTSVFIGLADGKKVKKKCSFKTILPKYKLYRVSKKSETLHVKAGTTILLYMVPSHRKDLLESFRMKGEAKAVFLDQNTLKITLSKRRTIAKVSIKFANTKSVSFKVE